MVGLGYSHSRRTQWRDIGTSAYMHQEEVGQNY